MIEGKNSLNTVSLEGYLKETNLQMKVVNGREAITGSITISVAENEDYRIRFFNYKTTSTGEDSANYLALRELMSDQAMSIATILKADGRLTFSQAALQATQVWARGRFGVYDRKDERGEVHTFITLEGIRAGVKNNASRHPFAPEATFDIEAYVLSKSPENVEDGRVTVSLAIPDWYRETAVPVSFICEDESSVQCIASYERGMSGRFVGRLKNFRKEEQKAAGKVVRFMDGSVSETRPTYSFVEERIIDKMTYPYEEGDEKYIDGETMKNLLANREMALSTLESAPRQSASAPAVPAKKFML